MAPVNMAPARSATVRQHGAPDASSAPELAAPPPAADRRDPRLEPGARATKILVIDDRTALGPAVQHALGSLGFEIVIAHTAAAALAAIAHADVVVSGDDLADMDCVQLLDHVRRADPAVPVILVAARGSERLAVRALQHGAYDYLPRPLSRDDLAHAIARAAHTRRHRIAAHDGAIESGNGARIIGNSPALQRIIEAAIRVASRDVTVLVRGETGSGKELIASLLHAHSARAQQPLVVFNSAAIPPELAESHLFGHTRGAFTGAVTAREGCFVQAHGGTLFLDEIGELPLGVQAKLLRVLQEREIQVIGASQVTKVDVRVIAATHRDLAADVRAGRFREDLYYRLNVVELVVPPLRERRADVAPLAREFARRYSERFSLDRVVELSPQLLDHLQRQPWPGNVRELENTVARCVAFATTDTVGLEALDASDGEPHDSAAPSGRSFREQVEAFERTVIEQTIQAAGGNLSEVARRLQIYRATLYNRLRKYGLLKG